MLLVAATIIVALEIALRATIVAVKLTAFTAIVAIATAFVAALRLAALIAAAIIVAVEFALAVALLVAALALRATEAAFVAVAASARVAALAAVSAVAAAVVVRSVAARIACALVIVCHLQCLPLNLARLDVLHARSERTSIHFLFPVRLYFQNLENAVGASEEQPFLREQYLALRKARCGLKA